MNITNWLIADRCNFYRKGLADFIKNYQPDACVTETKSGREALKNLTAAPPTIIIANIDLEMMDGIELFKTIVHRGMKHHHFVFVSEIHWIDNIYSRYANYLLWHLKQSGVKCISSKEELDDITIQHIYNSIIHNKPFISESLNKAYYEATEENVFVNKKLQTLSEREQEYLLHFANHKSQHEIAAAMHIETNTVNTYREIVLKKFGLSNSNELKRFCSTYHLCNLNSYSVNSPPPYKIK